MQAFTAILTMPPKAFDDKYNEGQKRAVMTVRPCTPDGKPIGDKMTVSKPDYTTSGKIIMSLSKGDVVWLAVAGKKPKGENKGDPYFDVLSFVGPDKRAYLDPCKALGRQDEPANTSSSEPAKTDRRIYKTGLPAVYVSAYAAIVETAEDQGTKITPEAAATLASAMTAYLEHGGREAETANVVG
jgi:hypothetical protein